VGVVVGVRERILLGTDDGPFDGAALGILDGI